MLKGSGLKVGLFISPSIHKITERIQINGEPISENNFAEELNNIWRKLSRKKKGFVQFFIIYTILGIFMHIILVQLIIISHIIFCVRTLFLMSLNIE